MKRGVGILILLVLGVFVFSFISEYTGATSYYGWSGRYTQTRPERDTTQIKIVSPDVVNEHGRYIVPQGGVVYFNVYPGDAGIWDDKVELRNAVSSQKYDNVEDICKIGFELNPGVSDSGSNCFTDRTASFRIPSYIEPGKRLVISACPSSVETNDCVDNRVYSDIIVVEKPSRGPREKTFYQGQTDPDR